MYVKLIFDNTTVLAQLMAWRQTVPEPIAEPTLAIVRH